STGATTPHRRSPDGRPWWCYWRASISASCGPCPDRRGEFVVVVFDDRRHLSKQLRVVPVQVEMLNDRRPAAHSTAPETIQGDNHLGATVRGQEGERRL